MQALKTTRIKGKKALAYQIESPIRRIGPDSGHDSVKTAARVLPVRGTVLFDAPTPDDPIRALVELFRVLQLHGRWQLAQGEAGPAKNRRQKFEKHLKEWCGAYGLLGLLPDELSRGRIPVSEVRRFFTERPPDPPQDFLEDEVFWRGYSEPVADMMMAAGRLYRVAQVFAMGGRDADHQMAVREINRLTSGRRLVARLDGSVLTAEWAADSLLSLLATSLLYAPKHGYRFGVCAAEDCRMVFATRRSDSKWCPGGNCRARVWARENPPSP